MKADPLERPVVAALTLGALALVLGLPGLGSTGLVRMEGQVAVMAREMLASGEFVVPRLFGELFTYKPPLFYWLVAAAFSLTGSTAEWVVRLPSALSGLTVGLATLLFSGRVVGYRVGLVAGAASFSSVLFLQKLRLAEFDAVFAALVGVAVASACYALVRQDDRGTGASWLLCYLALTAALLTKGILAAATFFPGLLLAALWTRRMRRLGHPAHLAGLAILGLSIVAYLWVAHAVAGWQAFAQPMAEGRLRGAEWSLEAFGRTLAKPALILAYFLPWSVALLWGRPSRVGSSPDDRLASAAWGFLIAGTVVFMALPTHESRYYLPLAAPLGIAAALSLRRMESSRLLAAKLVPALLAGVAGLLVLGLGALPASPAQSLGARALLVALGLAALGRLAAAATRSRGRWPVTALLLLTALCFWGAETLAFGPRRAAGRDQRQVAAELRSSIPEGATIWLPAPVETATRSSALVYYLGNPARTFTAASGPPAGELCLFRTIDLEEFDWSRWGTTQRSPVRLVHRVEGPRWTYELYQRADPAVEGW